MNKIIFLDFDGVFYLNQGIDSGFRERELNSIWDSWFDRTNPFPSMAEAAGDAYISVVLARLKKDFPEECEKASKWKHE